MSRLLSLVLAAGALLSAQTLPSTIQTKNLAPYVPSPQSIVDRMLELAGTHAGETVYDLGCGDGRVVVTAAQKFRAKAVGVEISQRMVKEANENIKRAGVEDRASIIHGDLMDVDLSPANVVVLYLLRDSNDLVRPKLEKTLKPGTRVVSHDYEIRGWKPTAVEKSSAFKRDHAIFVYTVPQSFKK